MVTDKHRRPSGSSGQLMAPAQAGESAQIHSGHFMMSNLEDEDTDSDSLSDFPVDFSVGNQSTMTASGPVNAATAAVGVAASRAVSDAPAAVYATAGAAAALSVGATESTIADSGGGSGGSSISIDQSLTKLLCYLKLTYSGKITNPKWNDFRGMRFTIKDKIRLNNIIWREYHLQFAKQQKPRIVQFANPLADEAHSRPESVLIEGQYWKRRLNTICSEYSGWRAFYRQNRHRLRPASGPEPMDIVYDSDWLAQNTALDIKRRGVGTAGPDWPLSPRESHPQRAPSVNLLDDLLADFQLDPNLDSLLAHCDGFGFGGLLGGSSGGDLGVGTAGSFNGVGIAGGCSGGSGVNSDFIQPGLQQLQPSLDDFIGSDLFALLSSSAHSAAAAVATSASFVVPQPPPPPPLMPQPPPPPPPLQAVVNLSPVDYQRIVSTLQGLLARTTQPPAVVSALLDYLRSIGIHVSLPIQQQQPPLPLAPPPLPTDSQTLYRILRTPMLSQSSSSSSPTLPPPPPLMPQQQKRQSKQPTPKLQLRLSAAVPKSGTDCSSLSSVGSRIELPSASRHREAYLLQKQAATLASNSEQARRVSINSAFDALQTMLKVGDRCQRLPKSAVLHKAADELRRLRSKRAELRREADCLRAEAARLRADIGAACDQLPASSAAAAAGGAAPGGQRLVDGRRWFEDTYARNGVLHNWKFYVFSLMISDLFDAYNCSVSACTSEDFARTVLSWADQHCCLPKLRPAAHRALTQLCVSTSILTDPSRTAVQVLAGVHSGGLPISLSAATVESAATASPDPVDLEDSELPTD